LRLSDVNALGNPSSAGTRPIELAGGSLETRVTAGGNISTATTVSGNSTILPGRGSSGAGVADSFGTLSINGSQLIVTPGVNLSSGSTGEVDFTTGSLTGNATLNVANSATVNALIALSGAIGETGSRSLTKSGNGQLILNGKSSYGGGTTVTGGTLTVNGGSTSDSSSGTGSGAVSIGTGATLAQAADGLAEMSRLTLERSRCSPTAPLSRSAERSL
jgi:autotransporter-associated beta strand protein